MTLEHGYMMLTVRCFCFQVGVDVGRSWPVDGDFGGLQNMERRSAAASICARAFTVWAGFLVLSSDTRFVLGRNFFELIICPVESMCAGRVFAPKAMADGDWIWERGAI